MSRDPAKYPQPCPGGALTHPSQSDWTLWKTKPFRNGFFLSEENEKNVSLFGATNKSKKGSSFFEDMQYPKDVRHSSDLFNRWVPLVPEFDESILMWLSSLIRNNSVVEPQEIRHLLQTSKKTQENSPLRFIPKNKPELRACCHHTPDPKYGPVRSSQDPTIYWIPLVAMS